MRSSVVDAAIVKAIDVDIPGQVIVVTEWYSPEWVSRLIDAGFNPDSLAFIGTASNIAHLTRSYPTASFHYVSEFSQFPKPHAATAIVTSGWIAKSGRRRTEFFKWAIQALGGGGALINIGLSRNPEFPKPPGVTVERKSFWYAKPGMWLHIYRKQAQKSGTQASERLRSRKSPEKSEGRILRDRATARPQHTAASQVPGALPSQPKLWNFEFRGKAKGERDAALLAFLEEVYGPYLPAHRDVMRGYIKKKNPKLFNALRDYGFENLPEKFRMPSVRERVQERIQRAAAGDYEKLSPAEKKSVRTASQRRLVPKQH